MGSRQRLENIRPFRGKDTMLRRTLGLTPPEGGSWFATALEIQRALQCSLSSCTFPPKRFVANKVCVPLYGGCRAKASDICLQNIPRTIHYQEPRGKTAIPDTGSPLFETAEDSASATYFRFQSEEKAASVNRKVVRAMSRRRKQSSADKHGRP